MKTLSKSALVEALVAFASSAKEQYVPRIFSPQEIKEEASKVVTAFEVALNTHIWDRIDYLVSRPQFSLDQLAETAERNLRGEALIRLLRGVSSETPCEDELLPKLWQRLAQIVHESDYRPKNSQTDATGGGFFVRIEMIYLVSGKVIVNLVPFPSPSEKIEIVPLCLVTIFFAT